MSGDCFEKAIEVARDFKGSKIVHGTPVGLGPENFGKRYWHAWVEIKTRVGPVVIDLANNRKITMKRSQYYEIGQLDADYVWRYSLKEAAQELERTQTYGPWVPNWEELDETD